MKLWQKVTIGLIAGVISGLLLRERVLFIKPIGDIFINALKMVVVPLILLTLINGVTSIRDTKSLGRVGFKAVGGFVITTIFAVMIGISVALLVKPGIGVNILDKIDQKIVEEVDPEIRSIQFDFVRFIVDIVPSNIFEALISGNLLQVLFLGIFVGITLKVMGERARKLTELFDQLTQMSFEMINLVISFSPYGAFALTACIVGTQGGEILMIFGKLILSVLGAMLFQYVIFGVFIFVFARISPMPFYKKSIEYQAMAFSTSSTKATLPTAMKVCREKLGISEGSTSFILPLGSSINMDGMSIYLSLCAIFFAQALGVELSIMDYLILTITATIGSIGGAGVPAGSLIMLPMVLSSINLPIEGVYLIAGIDRILDMVRTTINVTGDATITLIVDKSEGTLDEKI